MRILVVNPNTTARMTETIGASARAVAAAGTEIIAVNPTKGPPSIEGHYDEAVSVIGMLEEIRRGEQEGCDGYVIACFGDPGLDAAREIARGPVIGLAEAAFHAASFLATAFSVVTTLGRTCVITRHLLERYGMAHLCRNIRATEIAVLDLEDESGNARRAIADECRRAVEEDLAGAIVLGCAGMTDFAREISEEIGVPVVDGVPAAVKFVEALVAMGLRTSKHGDLAAPIAKSYTGSLDYLSPPVQR